MVFRDRIQAARLLGERLSRFKGTNPLVLGVPRGAVPMAKVVADAIQGELDIVLVHKFTLPDHPEFALGAVTEEGDVFLGSGAERMGLNESDVYEAAHREVTLLQAKRHLFTPGRGGPAEVKGRAVIIVDDGIATGATITAAVRSVRDGGASRVIVAAPVASSDAMRRIAQEGAELYILHSSDFFFAVSEFYEEFGQVSDQEVVQTLEEDRKNKKGRKMPREKALGSEKNTGSGEVTIDLGAVSLKGFLTVPRQTRGVVLFAHGSGSGRLSPRNQYVAKVLHKSGIATFLVDLLTDAESQDRNKVFDIDLLSERLTGIMEWMRTEPRVAKLPVGLFGASTGAAAAIRAAVREGASKVGVVVSRGGRPDLADSKELAGLRAATLFIVGGDDEPVLTWNRAAYSRLKTERKLIVIDRATHLFEEPGTLEEAAEAAREWFSEHFPRTGPEVKTDGRSEERVTEPLR